MPGQLSRTAALWSGTRNGCLEASPGLPRTPAPQCAVSQVTGIPMNCSVKLQLSLYIKAIKGIG